jgi:hypothetical protein
MIYSSHCFWNSSPPISERGILVGTDISQEWLLSWWWQHYHKTNDYPVAFVDFGMSSKAKQWCQKQGIYVSLPVADIFVLEKEAIKPTTQQDWERKHGKHFWNQRNAWFKKPLACLKTPFQTSIWIDLDCQIIQSIHPIFDFVTHLSDVGMVKEDGNEIIYNSGVIVFQRGNPLFERWASFAIEKNGDFRGDQEALSALITKENYPIRELPPLYNWSRLKGFNQTAYIVHWHGHHGKNYIRYACS